MKAVILAAGKGTRMQGLGDLIAKPVLPVGNVPALVWAAYGLRSAGVDEIILIVGHRADDIRIVLGDGSRIGLWIQYIRQERPLGTGDALKLARASIGAEPFITMYGDIVCSHRNFGDLVELYRTGKAAAWMAVHEDAEAWKGGVVVVRDGRVVDLVEKPPPGSIASNLINAGLFVFLPEIFAALDEVELSQRGEVELTSAVGKLLERGCVVGAAPIRGFWVNLTDPASYLAANRCVLAERVGAGDRLKSDRAVVHSEATLAEPVAIDEGSCTGRAYLGPFVSVGKACRVDDGAHLSNCVLLDGSVVEKNARVENAVLAPGSEVGPSATVAGPTPAVVFATR